MFFVFGRINEELLRMVVFEIRRVEEEERFIYFNFVGLCIFWIVKLYLCVIFFLKIR